MGAIIKIKLVVNNVKENQHLYTRILPSIHIHIYVHIYIYAYTYKHIYIYIYIHIHIRVHTRSHAYAYTYTYTCIYIRWVSSQKTYTGCEKRT